MRVLVFNSGNLDDVIQMLPAFTDAQRAHAHLTIDVIVDERWREVPQWHNAVGQVFTIPSHSWQRGLISVLASDDIKRLRKQLRKYNYDWVIDLYGGWLSAWFARTMHSVTAGFSRVDQKNRSSALLYNRRVAEEGDVHRVQQVRRLTAHCLNYAVPKTDADYGLDGNRFCAHSAASDAICLMLGCKDINLRLGVADAKLLVQQLCSIGRPIKLLWRDRVSGEYLRTIAEQTNAELTPSLKISGIASVLLDSRAVISVDNGLSHLAAALSVPMVRLQRASTPSSRVAHGGRQRVLLDSEHAWTPNRLIATLEQLIASAPPVAPSLAKAPVAANLTRVH